MSSQRFSTQLVSDYHIRVDSGTLVKVVFWVFFSLNVFSNGTCASVNIKLLVLSHVYFSRFHW